jgi:hypothetical protein
MISFFDEVAYYLDTPFSFKQTAIKSKDLSDRNLILARFSNKSFRILTRICAEPSASKILQTKHFITLFVGKILTLIFLHNHILKVG